jgi:chaperone modulatory protein CbpM
MARFSVSSATASRSDGAIAVTASVLDATPSLAARDLAHACGAEVAWVERSPSEPVAGPEQWRFRGVDLRRALETRRLQRDFGVELDAAALILDLQHEVRRLKAALQAGQLGR